MSAHINEKPADLEKPIAIEWEILDDLKKLLVNPKLSKDQPKALSVKDNVI